MPLTISIVSLVVSIGAFSAAICMNYLQQGSNRLNVHENLFGHNRELLRMFVEKPQHRPYIYGRKNKLPDEADDLHNEVSALCEMWIDFFELVAFQIEHVPVEIQKGWRDYVVRVFDGSRVLNDYYERNKINYTEKLAKFLNKDEYPLEELVTSRTIWNLLVLKRRSGGARRGRRGGREDEDQPR